jgi:hypothetical protein
MEKKKKLPIYELVISNLPDESGVDYVAMVDEPAIEDRGMWLMFDKQKEFIFKTSEPEKRIISGFAMVADMPIYRRDEIRGEYYVVFSSNTIEDIVKKFAKNNYFNNVNVMHDDEAKVDGVYMIESFLVDSKRGIGTPKGFDKAPDGSWYVSYFVENEQIWNEFIKTGVFKGFSVEGLFGYALEPQKQVAVKDYVDLVNSILDSL